MFGLTTLGGIIFSAFAAYESKWRRVIKTAIGVGIGVGVSAALGRGWFVALLGLVFVAVAVIHGWWLPKNGVNGVTAEPRERYLELRRGSRP